MSSFFRMTKRPDTGTIEYAEWLDGHFGPHRYGVRFPSDGKIYHENLIRESSDAKEQDTI